MVFLCVQKLLCHDIKRQIIAGKSLQQVQHQRLWIKIVDSILVTGIIFTNFKVACVMVARQLNVTFFGVAHTYTQAFVPCGESFSAVPSSDNLLKLCEAGKLIDHVGDFSQVFYCCDLVQEWHFQGGAQWLKITQKGRIFREFLIWHFS